MRRHAVIAVVGALTALLVTCGASAASAAPAASAVSAADAGSVNDPNATGALTLCGQNGQAITSGSVTARPFVWRVVSTVSAPAPYNGAGRTAALFAFQPRPQVEPTEWSGDLMTASARYSNATHPMAAATKLDEPLSTFLDEFPAKVNGLVQLRMFLGAPQQPAYTQKYAAATIQVTGNTWHLVGPAADASCTSGSAVSMESILSKAVTQRIAGAQATETPVPTSSKPPASGGSKSPSSTSGGGADAGVASGPLATELTSSSSHRTRNLELAVSVLALAFAVSSLGWWLVRRRGDARS